MVNVAGALRAAYESGQTMTTTAAETRTYSLNLLENGIDFMQSGIETYFPVDSPDWRAHKYAILHLWSGTLLILKERLRRIDPGLVYVRAQRPGEVRRKTVDFDQALDRLATNGVWIDPKKLAVLRTIQNIRNNVEHFDLTLNLDEAKAVISELVGFLHGFCIDELNLYIEDRLSEAAQHRLWELQEVTDKLTDILAETARLDAEADRAYFREFADKYATMTLEELRAEANKDLGSELSMLECLDCREYSVVTLAVGVCLNEACRAWFYLENCHSCFVPIIEGRFNCRLCGP
jgi:hypothetical protein